MKLFKGYLMYYQCKIYLINQHDKEFEFLGLDYFRYFQFNISIFSPRKTRVPALVVKLILFGCGFEFCTHDKL